MSYARPSHLSRQVGFVFPFTSPSFSFASSAFASLIEEYHLFFSSAGSFMRQRRIGQRLVLFVPIVLGVCPPRLRFTDWSVASVLESATWHSSSVFVSFYLCDLQHEIDGIRSLGPFVAAGSRIG